ncbi:DUF397 domain-containing protein [Streptomyces sp. XM4011]|uniref:DUF397 domain-containing protein n=1 Tax=Streptomyces TaxID=1883 RepID=UPI001FF8FB72|nr:DUF397 domain-containing protein [Streptomyces sp. XM4011]MCK1816683.1 DUF397 domain-containing protein [Streptomyces sp. XM4011]
MSQFSFRKSSYSTGGDSGICVEVATNIPALVAIRDSKRPTGPVLHLTPTAWSAFLSAATATATATTVRR